jgi:hypothetical protein
MGFFFGCVFFHPFNKSSSSALGFLPAGFLPLGLLREPAGLSAQPRRSDLGQIMTPKRRRKCRHCRQLYDPDPRNRFHQRYCSQPACRQASKSASQCRWRASPKGRDYFRGLANLLRVQIWRKAHPGYWRRRRSKPGALQDHCLPQDLVPPADKPTLSQRALQDVILTQGLMLTGLLAQLTGCALQENIASTTRRLILLGQQVQGPSGGRQKHARGQTSAVPRALAASPLPVQLDRPSAGSG